MAKVGIFFGSTTGVTEDIAHKIAEKIDGAEVFNIDGNEDKLETLEKIKKRRSYERLPYFWRENQLVKIDLS